MNISMIVYESIAVLYSKWKLPSMRDKYHNLLSLLISLENAERGCIHRVFCFEDRGCIHGANQPQWMHPWSQRASVDASMV